MSKISVFLANVHNAVQNQNMPILPYTAPKIYTGGLKVSEWAKASKAEKQKALSKEWYVYYAYIDENGKLKRMPNIKAGANYFKTKTERLQILRTIRRNLHDLLKRGFNPRKPDAFTGQPAPDSLSVRSAFAHALAIKKKTLNETSYINFEGRIKRFQKWLDDRGYLKRYVTSITLHTVNDYLNHVLQTSSAANRNNARLDISSLFTTLQKEFIITDNFVKLIDPLKSTPQKNKSYSIEQQEVIFKRMEDVDPLLARYVKFVAYGFLRPVEVCRLRFDMVDLRERTFKVLVKNGQVETIIIPEALLSEIPEQGSLPPDAFLFTPTGPGEWGQNEAGRRSYWGKRYDRVVKKVLGLSNEYNIYSWRHTYAVKIYLKLLETKTPDEAEGYLMTITRHRTREALRKYLRGIGAYRPDDFSKYL
jgi:integrase